MNVAVAPSPGLPRDAHGMGLMGSTGLREAACETLRWDHRASADEWWSGPATGVAFGGQMVQSQTPQIRHAIKRHFDVFSSEFADSDGVLTLPHAALLARALR
ncbi:hypothetical protein [Streptomyces sp. LN590]|uniref:hypothetical protein n=1 Tax=Streptomyces sp. LN590 TaxID=3112980 RepID=UPI00371393E4